MKNVGPEKIEEQSVPNIAQAVLSATAVKSGNKLTCQKCAFQFCLNLNFGESCCWKSEQSENVPRHLLT